MPLKSLALAALTALFATASQADGPMHISDAIAFATPTTAMSGSGYLQITNTGITDDRLIAVQADYPRVELHTVETDAAGVTRMVHLSDGIALPAGETVTLRPGATHVMFMGLRGTPFVAGETVAATLVFETAAPLPVTFEIVARDMAHNH